jgi:hypothetical protein
MYATWGGTLSSAIDFVCFEAAGAGRSSGLAPTWLVDAGHSGGRGRTTHLDALGCGLGQLPVMGAALGCLAPTLVTWAGRRGGYGFCKFM